MCVATGRLPTCAGHTCRRTTQVDPQADGPHPHRIACVCGASVAHTHTRTLNSNIEQRVCTIGRLEGGPPLLATTWVPSLHERRTRYCGRRDKKRSCGWLAPAACCASGHTAVPSSAKAAMSRAHHESAHPLSFRQVEWGLVKMEWFMYHPCRVPTVNGCPQAHKLLEWLDARRCAGPAVRGLQ